MVLEERDAHRRTLISRHAQNRSELGPKTMKLLEENTEGYPHNLGLHKDALKDAKHTTH